MDAHKSYNNVLHRKRKGSQRKQKKIASEKTRYQTEQRVSFHPIQTSILFCTQLWGKVFLLCWYSNWPISASEPEGLQWWRREANLRKEATSTTWCESHKIGCMFKYCHGRQSGKILRHDWRGATYFQLRWTWRWPSSTTTLHAVIFCDRRQRTLCLYSCIDKIYPCVDDGRRQRSTVDDGRLADARQCDDGRLACARHTRWIAAMLLCCMPLLPTCWLQRLLPTRASQHHKESQQGRNWDNYCCFVIQGMQQTSLLVCNCLLLNDLPVAHCNKLPDKNKNRCHNCFLRRCFTA